MSVHRFPKHVNSKLDSISTNFFWGFKMIIAIYKLTMQGIGNFCPQSAQIKEETVQ